MDPPPDPGARHRHACTACGAPLHEDQAACLSCGAMVKEGAGRAGIRRAALGSATALLVLGGAVGAAVAGLPHGKHVHKTPLAQVPGQKKAPPQATADSSGTGNAPTLPGAGDGTTTPPAIHPSPTHTTHTPSTPSGGSSTGGSGSGSSGGSGSGGSSSGGSNGHKSTKNDTPSGHKDQTAKPPSGPKLFVTGEQPAEAGVFDGGPHPGAGTSGNTIDGDAGTAWTGHGTNTGVYVTPNPGDYKRIAIVSETAGYDASLYFTRASSPPHDLASWTPTGGVSNADARQTVKLHGNARKGTYYLVLLTGFPPGKTRVLFNEIQLFQ